MPQLTRRDVLRTGLAATLLSRSLLAQAPPAIAPRERFLLDFG
jgi:hypothetical protein